jgi:hypothetical protein
VNLVLQEKEEGETAFVPREEKAFIPRKIRLDTGRG